MGQLPRDLLFEPGELVLLVAQLQAERGQVTAVDVGGEVAIESFADHGNLRARLADPSELIAESGAGEREIAADPPVELVCLLLETGSEERALLEIVDAPTPLEGTVVVFDALGLAAVDVRFVASLGFLDRKQPRAFFRQDPVGLGARTSSGFEGFFAIFGGLVGFGFGLGDLLHRVVAESLGFLFGGLGCFGFGCLRGGLGLCFGAAGLLAAVFVGREQGGAFGGRQREESAA